MSKLPSRWLALSSTLTGLGMLLTLASGAYDGVTRWVLVVIAVASLTFALVFLLWPRRTP